MPDHTHHDSDRLFLQQAIDQAVASVRNGGGPFGAVLVAEGEVIALAGNLPHRVTFIVCGVQVEVRCLCGTRLGIDTHALDRKYRLMAYAG